MSKDLTYLIALTKLPKVGNVTAHALISYCGGAGEVFSASAKALTDVPGVGKTIMEGIIVNREKALEDAESEVVFAAKNNIRQIAFSDDAYPSRLRIVPDAPLVLHYRGGADFNHQRTVGIVGTRMATDYGRLMCERIVQELKPYNTLIVSGLAVGIDSVAHRTALQESMPTIAIMGHGLDIVYPAEQKSLARRLVESDTGALFTEYSMGSKAAKEHFPMRNRLIAAMSDVLLVVETQEKGGSIITVNRAIEYKKDIFAIPGRTTDKYSEGCNHLIKSGQARMTERAADIAEALKWPQQDRSRFVQSALFADLDETETQLVKILREKGEVGIDVLGYQVSLPPSQMASVLLNLEFKGVIRSLPGKRYQAI